MSKIKYIPELNGLRAFAVLSVLIYHLEKVLIKSQTFSGGFLGVDIFFVISGYLISLIIFRDLLVLKKFSLLSFYKKRVRRIIPALLFIILFSITFSIIFFLPSDLVDNTKAMISSIFFVSNFYFYFSNIVYGADLSLTKPLLHTWSLSVEEQFYIFFPVLFILIDKNFKNFIYFILFFLFSSFLFAEYLNSNYRSVNFYILISRAWELLAGSLIAYIHLFPDKFKFLKKISFNNNIKNTISFLGFLCLLLSIFFFREELNHPSHKTLLVVIGTSVLIYFINDQNSIFNKILRFKLFVFIGLISYSLYLWHYPILTFTNYLDIYDGNKITLVIIILTIFLLSIFTYYFIEKPARNKKYKFTVVMSIIVFFVSIILILSLKIFYSNGNLKKLPQVLENAFNNLNYRNNLQNKKACHDRLGTDGFCKFYNHESKIVLLGDSMTDSLLGSFKDTLKGKNYSIVHMSYSGQLYLPNFFVVDKSNNKINSSLIQHEQRQLKLNEMSEDTYVIIMGNYLSYLEKDIVFENGKIEVIENKSNLKFVENQNINLNYNKRTSKWKKSLKRNLINLSQNKKILLVYPLPKPPINISRHIKKNFINGNLLSKDYHLKDEINYDKKIYEQTNKEIIDLFNSITSKNIYKIKTKDVYCPENKCIFYDNNNIYFFDNVHLSYYGSKILSSIILNKIEKIDKSN